MKLTSSLSLGQSNIDFHAAVLRSITRKPHGFKTIVA
jgi:hypothetical protein